MGRSLRPDKDPARRCLRVEEWPAADQRAWRTAIESGDVLDPGGAGAEWAAATRRGISASYGLWLTWLMATGNLDQELGPEVRVTPRACTQLT